MKTHEALSKLAYSTIAAKILMYLYSQHETRSSTLVKKITEETGCSEPIVYLTLRELTENNLVFLPTDRPRFKMYALTENGTKTVEDEVKKTETETGKTMDKFDEPTIIEYLTEDLLRGLPSKLRTISNRMVVRREVMRTISEARDRVARQLEGES